MKTTSVVEIIDERSVSAETLLTEVIVVEFESKKASAMLQKFTDELPLQQSDLNHLKRIRKKDKNLVEMVLCPKHYYDTYLDGSIKELFESTRIVAVPRLAPLTTTGMHL